MASKHSIFSFFSGVGFLDLGFETENFSIKYVNEFFTPFLDAYYHARNCLNLDLPEYGNYNYSITDLIEKDRTRLENLVKDARKTSDIVGFIGGPPCPDFSIAGKNKGGEGDNGRLSSAYVELICSQTPDFFLFENVKGLWKTKKHREFYESMKHKLHEKEYVTTEMLINAIEYGAPQDRERIILLGFHRDLIENLDISYGSDMTLQAGTFPWRKYALHSKAEIADCYWPTTNPFIQNGYTPAPNGIIQELTVEHWFKRNEVSCHPNAEHHFIPRAALSRFLSIDEGDDSKKSFKRLHRWRYSPTVAYGNNEVHIHPYKPRRISAAEALALQSLPKAFELPANMTLSNMFKTIGNGVPFLAARALARSISDFLEGASYDYNEAYRYGLSVGD